jgi:hypothetical protein
VTELGRDFCNGNGEGQTEKKLIVQIMLFFQNENLQFINGVLVGLVNTLHIIIVKWIIFQLVGRRSFKKNTINQELNIDQIVQFGGFGTILFYLRPKVKYLATVFRSSISKITQNSIARDISTLINNTS